MRFAQKNTMYWVLIINLDETLFSSNKSRIAALVVLAKQATTAAGW
ncbi:hypothetical protein ACK31R_17475 [Aeromonas caviae]